MRWSVGRSSANAATATGKMAAQATRTRSKCRSMALVRHSEGRSLKAFPIRSSGVDLDQSVIEAKNSSGKGAEHDDRAKDGQENVSDGVGNGHAQHRRLALGDVAT